MLKFSDKTMIQEDASTSTERKSEILEEFSYMQNKVEEMQRQLDQFSNILYKEIPNLKDQIKLLNSKIGDTNTKSGRN